MVPMTRQEFSQTLAKFSCTSYQIAPVFDAFLGSDVYGIRLTRGNGHNAFTAQKLFQPIELELAWSKSQFIGNHLLIMLRQFEAKGLFVPRLLYKDKPFS